jgi:hypothetical protein
VAYKGPYLSKSRIASFLLVLAFAGVLTAQLRPRIDQRVDNARVIRLDRTTHPLARLGRDLGRAAADVPMERIQMQLSSSPEQQAALEELFAGHYDAASPHFQEWLTPAKEASIWSVERRRRRPRSPG